MSDFHKKKKKTLNENPERKKKQVKRMAARK